MDIFAKFRRALRGGVSPAVLTREVLRRRRQDRHRVVERGQLDARDKQPARLGDEYAALTPRELLHHFRRRDAPAFWSGDLSMLDGDRNHLVATADAIADDSTWELAGFGALTFKGDTVWRRDPLGDEVWGLEYHADVAVYRHGGPDIRVLWELNRLGHVLPLSRAYAGTNDERYAEAFFAHIETWIEQNPFGRGANWNCAMEVALRAINLLAAFDIFRASASCTEQRLTLILRLFDQHGRFILDNNEFSYIATSNHYLSDVIGLFWIGTLLPELRHAAEWREFGLRETLSEMDKQVLGDGSDFEASTGYHKFVCEMFLFTFFLARKNGIEISRKYQDKLRTMLDYIRAIIRPDGLATLIGDADGSQIIPVVRRDADDMQYLLDLGAVVLDDASIATPATSSAAFPDAGAYILRDGDLYLYFNTNDCGLGGRGSHGHNDALSIEVSALGRPFIIDPGSYAYNLDRAARHDFRSTAWHSTVMIDGVEQNTTDVELPFILGNEAKPRAWRWLETSPDRDGVVAEHGGYRRLPSHVTHQRTVEFYKSRRAWRITDFFRGEGEHRLDLSFHVAPGLKIDIIDTSTARLHDRSGRALLIRASGLKDRPGMIDAARSSTYGHKEATQILRWTMTGVLPHSVAFLLVPVAPGESIDARLAIAEQLTQNND